MNSTTQGSVDEIAARALTNGALAERVQSIADFPRTYKREQRSALLAEAARRLRWPDAYGKHQQGATTAEPTPRLCDRCEHTAHTGVCSAWSSEGVCSCPGTRTVR